MRKGLAILINNLLGWGLGLIGRGSSIPSLIALKIYPDLLRNLNYPNKIIGITGSNGKSTTSFIIADCLRKNGYKVTHNKHGSNILYGVASTIIKDCDLKGNVKTDVLVLELDEKWIKIMKNHFRIDYLLITNLEREQAFRNGNPELVLKEILKKIDKTTKLILNADDPFTGKIMNLYKGSKPIYYGVNKNAKSNSSTCNLIDIAYCPKCSSKLNFNYFNYDNIGSFNCTKCDYKNPKTNYNISKIDFKKDTIFFDKLSLKINNCLPYNIYNYSAAYALLRTIGLKEKKIIDGFKKRTFDKNNKSYVYKGRNTYFVLSKPECAPSFNQSINHLLEKKELITVVFGLSEISRRYPEQDISWLYDINFEALKNVKIDKIICIGDYAYDLATRLKYADIEDNKILIETKLKNLNLALSKTKGDIYALIYHGALKKVFDKEVGEK